MKHFCLVNLVILLRALVLLAPTAAPYPLLFPSAIFVLFVAVFVCMIVFLDGLLSVYALLSYLYSLLALVADTYFDVLLNSFIYI